MARSIRRRGDYLFAIATRDLPHNVNDSMTHRWARNPDKRFD
jgi:hypothetical protein